jgi:hypothetical protein
VEFDRCTRFFLQLFGFRGSASKLCRLLISWSIVSFHGASGECHVGRDLGTIDGGSSLCGEEELVLLICDLEQRHVSGGDYTGEVQCPTFHGGNPRSGLNWLCLAIALLKAHCFESDDFL